MVLLDCIVGLKMPDIGHLHYCDIVTKCNICRHHATLRLVTVAVLTKKIEVSAAYIYSDSLHLWELQKNSTQAGQVIGVE